MDGGGKGTQQRLAESQVRKLSIPVFYGSCCWEKQLGLLTAQMRTNKVKLVELPQTGTGDGCASPSPVIYLSHFLDEVSNQ